MQKRYRVSGPVPADYVTALSELGVRVAVVRVDGKLIYRGGECDVFPKQVAPTCVIVECEDKQRVEQLLKEATVVVIALDKSADVQPLPSSETVGRDVFDLAFAGIYAGGAKKWTAGEEQRDCEKQTAALERYGVREGRVLVPLAGDVPFVAHVKAKEITAVEWSSVALDRLRKRFPDGVVPDNVHLIEAEWYAWAAAYKGPLFTHVFDKDAFGFCNPTSRSKYVDSVSRLLAVGGVVYLEVKHRLKDKEQGPPFHVGAEEIASSWIGFELTEDLGVVVEYKQEEGLRQMAYILTKKNP